MGWERNVGHQLLSCLHSSLQTKLELFIFKVVSAWIDLASSAVSQSHHSPSTGRGHSREVLTWLLYMLTPPWHYAAGEVRLPQVAASPQPFDLRAVNPMRNVRCATWKPNMEQMKLQTVGRKETKQKKGRKQTGSRNKGVWSLHTQTQSRRSWANSALGVVLLSGVLWQRFGFVRQGAGAGTWG